VLHHNQPPLLSQAKTTTALNELWDHTTIARFRRDEIIASLRSTLADSWRCGLFKQFLQQVGSNLSLSRKSNRSHHGTAMLIL